MNYTIITGENARYIIGLDKNGNRYSVSAWDKVTHSTIQRESADTYTAALVLFGRFKFRYKVAQHQYTDISLADFANID